MDKSSESSEYEDSDSSNFELSEGERWGVMSECLQHIWNEIIRMNVSQLDTIFQLKMYPKDFARGLKALDITFN